MTRTAHGAVQVLALTFIFGNSAKTAFESVLFLVGWRPARDRPPAALTRQTRGWCPSSKRTQLFCHL
jgi:hypothetical protein